MVCVGKYMQEKTYTTLRDEIKFYQSPYEGMSGFVQINRRICHLHSSKPHLGVPASYLTVGPFAKAITGYAPGKPVHNL